MCVYVYVLINKTLRWQCGSGYVQSFFYIVIRDSIPTDFRWEQGLLYVEGLVLGLTQS